MEKNISIQLSDKEIMDKLLLGEDKNLLEKISIGDKVELLPLFTTFKSKKVVGGNEVLNFLLSVPVGVTTGIIANYLYSWFLKSKTSKIRIEKTEITITEDKETTIKIIIETLEK